TPFRGSINTIIRLQQTVSAGKFRQMDLSDGDDLSGFDNGRLNCPIRLDNHLAYIRRYPQISAQGFAIGQRQLAIGIKMKAAIAGISQLSGSQCHFKEPSALDRKIELISGRTNRTG